MKTGSLLKLNSKYSAAEKTVHYELPLGGELLSLNELVGKALSLEFTGNIYCVKTDKKIKKSYGQGYSWESYITSPECDKCIFRPELCHYSAGTCRDSEWGEQHCLQPHIIYLSLTSGVKIGITRKSQLPTRWIDQGAVRAIKLCEVKDRLTSGRVEVEIAKVLSDKTNWRNMLKNVYDEIDLVEMKKNILEKFSPLLEKNQATICSDDVFTFAYPVDKYPEKVTAFNLDKDPRVQGTLWGVKGQYLIFDTGVINIRKFQGYEVKVVY